jgi:hypothetical protein
MYVLRGVAVPASANVATWYPTLQDWREQLTVRTIERETALTSKTIQRNAAACNLYTAAACEEQRLRTILSVRVDKPARHAQGIHVNAVIVCGTHHFDLPVADANSREALDA